MTDKTEAQHEAPRLADRLEDFALALPAYGFDDRPPKEAAAELRRQHASVQKLEAQLITQTNRAASAEQQITALTQRLDMANAMGNEARDKLAQLSVRQDGLCQRCQGSGEDPEGYFDQSRGPDGDNHDGPCRACAGSGEARQRSGS